MDPRKSSVWGGDDISSVGDAQSKKKFGGIDESVGIELCEKPRAEEIVFSEKMKLNSEKDGSVSPGGLLDVEDDKEKAEDGEEVSSITLSGKKKKKKKKSTTLTKSSNLVRTDLLEEEKTETFTCRHVEDVIVDEEKKAADGAGEKDGEEEETVESTSAKKKKKKKDKKAAVASVPTSSVDAKQENSVSEPSQPKKKDAKVKVAEKKVPKRVREMQEILARRQAAEEEKKREEEDKLRKEEEERRLQEELEREAEEIRQARLVRRKENRQKRKQEGELLTAKQKTEALKREAFKKMVLTDATSLLVVDKNGDSSKRPVYGNKKKLARGKANDSASVQVKDDVIESAYTEEKHGAVDVTQESGDEEDNWDAKSMDSVNLNLKGASDDNEELKDTASKAHDSGIIADRQTVNAGVTGKPTTAAKKAMSKVNDATRPKDTSKKGKGSVLNEVGGSKREENLRSPICCIMGHVDTGKTKLLDCMRGTNVQEGEAGGITQQIGATYFPSENIRERTKELKADAKFKVPGLLVIDTPGHEAFTNLRSRGSKLCDIAVLVVDIMHGLEPQTIESLNMLRRKNVKFIIALNKVDRLFKWKPSKNAPIMKTIMQQSSDVIMEFERRLTHVITQFKEQGLNTELYYKNREMRETFSIVPTSAISGEGIPDLLLLLVQWAQKTMVEKLTYIDKVECTVLEVKVIEGHGTTIDVVLVNGVLHEGDQIVVRGSQGPIVTIVRSLLTPLPMKEQRVKGTYLYHREVKAAQGIKISAQGLEHAIAGTALHVIGPDEDVEEAKKIAMEDTESVMSWTDKSGEGVYAQASTMGSLEAFLELLKSPDVKIPVSGIGIGPVHKKDVMKAGAMLERKKEFATILAFDVKVTAEARELADKIGVNIFCDDTIYRVLTQFKGYIENIKNEKKKEAAPEVVFPCVLEILPNRIFRASDPIVLGVRVKYGILKVGTPICIFKRIDNVRVVMDIGCVATIHTNNKTPVDYARKEQEVAIKIIPSNPEENKMFGKHFGREDMLVSHITRRSIDVLRSYYWDEVSDDDKRLVERLEKMFKI